MNKLKIYIDNSVWNMYFDEHVPDLQHLTQQFFNTAKMGYYDLFISDFVVFEIAKASKARAESLYRLIDEILPIRLKMIPQVDQLAEQYVQAGIVTENSQIDALHVAAATIHNIDVLLSWNYRHLANINRRAKFIAFNISQGYHHPLQIITPIEVIENG